MSQKEKDHKPKTSKGLKNVVGIILAFAIPFATVALLNQFVLRNYSVPSASMETTLMAGDRLLANALYDNWEPERGQIVIFQDSEGWLGPQRENEYLVKRVIGLPGDTISCCSENNEILINGVPYPESYVVKGSNAEFPDQVVPEGYLFMLGDNRARSADSRVHIDTGTQFIPIESVKSKAAFRYWPLNEIGFIG